MTVFIPKLKTGDRIEGLEGSPHDYSFILYKLPAFNDRVNQELAGRLLAAWQLEGDWTVIDGGDFIKYLDAKIKIRRDYKPQDHRLPASVLNGSDPGRGKIELFKALDRMIRLGLLESPDSRSVIRDRKISPTPRFIKNLEAHRQRTLDMVEELLDNRR